MSKIKQFFRQSGLTKAQLLASALCYFLCFALFLGIVVIWNPLSLSSTPTEDSQAADGPTNTSGYWTETGRYDISWYNNPDTETYGDGSAEKPYKISTAAQLAGLSYLVYNNAVESSDVTTSGSVNYIFSDKYFEQTANIDLSAYYWQPIGINRTRDGTTRENYFSGSYDGGNHTVSGIFTPAGSSNAYSYQGLFGYVRSNSSTSPITIKNIGVTNSYIQGRLHVGGVVGYAGLNTTITNCYNTGAVTGSSNYVGGVVGDAYNASITNCYNTGTVTGSNSGVGGVVGYANAYSDTMTITNCYNTGTVSGSYSVGGVVGNADSNTTITNCYNTGTVTGSSTSVGGVVGQASGTITNCYNTGTVSGSSFVGGVVGDARSNTTITNCYNTGAVTGTATRYLYVGGVVGNANSSSSGTITITNCYNTGAVTGAATSNSSVGGVVGEASGSTTITNCYYGANCPSSVGGKNGADVPGQAEHSTTLTVNSPKELAWYTTESNWNPASPWNFTTWVLDSNENDGYPNLKGYWISEGRYDISWLNENAGTAEDPYIIDSAEDLAGLSWLVYNNPIEYFPAGSDYVFENAYFSQTASISLYEYYWQPIGVDYDRSGERVQNFFAGNYNGNQNLIIGIHVPAGDTDAYANQGVFGSVRAYNYGVLIEGITTKFFSRISAYRQIGGIAGEAINFGHNSIIFSRCASDYGLLYSSASDHSYVGGIVGFVTNGGQGDIIIEDCIGATSIRAEDNSGGIVGYASQNSNGEILIKNSFSTSSILNRQGNLVSQEFCGGIVGEGYNVTIVNCFSTEESIYGSVSSSSSVTDCYDTYPGADAWSDTSNFWDPAHPWDFENVWMWNYCDSAYPMHRYNFWDENPANYSTDWYFNAQTIDGYAPGTKQNPYIIDSEQDLAGLAYLVNKRQAVPSNQFTNVPIPGEDTALDSLEIYFCDQYILQTTDLDMSAYIWKPIGVSSAASNYDNYELKDYTLFAGNYDGGGHTISGLYTVGEDNGLFENLLSGEYLTQTFNITQEIEPFIPVLQNIIIKDSGISGYMSGSIASQVRGAHILNCQNYSTINLSSFSGGIVATIGNGSVIRNCYNYGNIINISGHSIGGIVGGVSEASAVITNCYNYGSIEIVDYGDWVGGVAGYNDGLIIDCHNAGDVSISGPAGGIAGRSSGRIDRCYNTGNILSEAQVGGIVGQLSQGSSSSEASVANSYNFGSVSTVNGTSGLGGIAGSIHASVIYNCYNAGSIGKENGSYFGGIVGTAEYATITNSYNTGEVIGYSTNVGGVVGRAHNEVTTTNCYYGGGVTGPLGNYGEYLSDIVNLAKNLSWYTDSSNWNSTYAWDFALTWQLESNVNDGYPTLKDPIDYWISDPSYYSIEWFTSSDKTTYGDGSASNPYIIDSAEDLAGLSWLVYTSGQTGNPLDSGTDYSTNGSDKFVFADKHFLQTKNIDMSAHVWQPIGIYYTRDGLTNINAFAGNYDGGNHTISGLSTPEGNITKCSYQGLFGYVSASTLDSQSSSTIKNVGIINSDISGSSDVGGVVGMANYNAILTNCYNTSLVSGYGSIGGVAGTNYGEMTGCYNAGTVTCLSDIGDVGGVVGKGSALTNCYNTGTVNALGGNVGGLAGTASSIVSKSYNAGNIILSVNSEFGDVKVGGISTSSYSAIDCFNKGSITVTINGTSNAYCNIYGITSISGEIVTDCYNTGNITVNGGTNVTICGIAYVNDQSSPKVFNSFNLGSFSTNSSANMHPITNAYSNNCYYADNSITDNSGATYLQDLTDKAKQQEWCEDTLSWDFTFCWKTNSSENNGYPIFKTADDPTDWWLADGNYDTSWFNNSNPSLYGAGTKENPYKIKDAQDLAGLSYIIYHPEEFGLQSVNFMDVYNSYLVDVYFVQTGDIDLSAHTWQPIGVAYDRFTNEEVNRAFAGNYDGQGYTISGINTPSGSLDHYSYQGLFGITTGYNDESSMPINTKLKNINIVNSSIGGNDTLGSIAALGCGVDITNCQSSAIIKGFTEANGGVGGIVGGSMLGNVSNCSFFGTFEPGYIALSESYISGIVGMAMMSTVENCDNFSSIVSNSSSNLVIAGIVGMAMNGTIIDCNNFGTLSGPSVAGIIAMIAEGSITNCGVFGNVILPSDSNTFAGIVSMNQNAQISNCLVDCTVRVDGDNETICAFAQIGTSDSGTFIDLCSSNINVIGSGSVASNNSSLDDVATNSYVLISGENIETTKNITTVTETMEGNFVYLDGFKNGLPVPVKTDGTNFFHMHAFGLTTGIVEKINDVFYPNLITEQVETETIYWNPEITEEPSIFEVEPIDLDLALEDGKTYEITLIIDGQETIVTQQATYENQSDPQNSPIYFAGGLNIDNLNGVNYSVMIMADCSVDVDGRFVYTPGKVFFTGVGSTNEGNIYQSVSLILKSIREVPN